MYFLEMCNGKMYMKISEKSRRNFLIIDGEKIYLKKNMNIEKIRKTNRNIYINSYKYNTEEKRLKFSIKAFILNYIL